MKKLAFVALLFLSPAMAADNAITWLNNSAETIAILKPPRIFTLHGEDGRTATIDFSGDEVKYSGELPVDDAAKVFFETMMRYTQAHDCKNATAPK